MSRNKILNRRTFLRGAGSVAIALPFLEEMRVSTVGAAENAVPTRCVTAFFGLGLSKEMQDEGFAGPLEPYQRFKDKMAFLTNVDMTQAAGGTAHVEGSPVIFVGEKKRNSDRSGGASIDQLMKRALHPNGVPTAVGTLASGMWFREGFAPQPLRCWNPDGSVAENPIKRPSLVFKKLFGDFVPNPEGTGPSAEELRELRLRRSVLDSVVAQYQHYISDASILGASSKEKLKVHLERIREVERKLVPVEDGMSQEMGAHCSPPSSAADPDINGVSYELKGATDKEAPTMPHTDFQRAYRLHADLYAMALRCDIVRFGNLLFESSGGHVRFTGKYDALGESLNFDGSNSEHGGIWHAGNRKDARLCQHFFQSNIAYFLGLLDDPEMLEANGKTVLDNSLIVVGTEVGWNHDLKPVFHGVAGGQGHFRPGFHNQEVNCVDVYNTLLNAFGIDAKIGVQSGLSKGNFSPLLL